jgi:D-proline reductase (dithiol) PrdB
MPRLDQLSELARKSALTHPAQLNDTAPWTAPTKPLAESTVALITTAGLHPRQVVGFRAGDPSYRVFPTDTPARELVLSHASIGFDRTGYMKDHNVIFPVDRLRELARAGEVGALGPNAYSFMGAQRPPYEPIMQTAAEVAGRLREERVDVVVLTGA